MSNLLYKYLDVNGAIMMLDKCIDVRYGMMVTSQARSVQYKDVVNKPNYYRDREDFFNY